MRRFYIFIWMLIAVGLKAQTVNPGFLSFSPFQFFRNAFMVNYETGIGKDKTLVFSPGVVLKDNANESLTGFIGELQFRYYLIHPSFDYMDTKYGGVRLQPYVAPYYQYSSIQKELPSYYYDPQTGNGKNYDLTRDITTHAGGVLVGCRGLLTKNLFVDLGIGGGFRLSQLEDSYSIAIPPQPVYESYDIFDYEYRGIAPKVLFTLGIRLY